jgi:hypothetical protein
LVADARRHDYRLGQQLPAFFSDALERTLSRPPEIVERGDRHGGRYGKRRTFLWDLFSDGADGFDFHLVVFSDAGAPEAAHPLVQRVFSHLIAMDDAARAMPCADDENEYLWSVTLDADKNAVLLDYVSTLWNSEWSVGFRVQEDGSFTCLGIPDPR